MVFSEEQFYFYMTTNTHHKVLYTGFTVNLKKRIKEHKDKTYKKALQIDIILTNLFILKHLKQLLKQEKENDK